jgi:DNA-binding MarR family transcriptional regulator
LLVGRAGAFRRRTSQAPVHGFVFARISGTQATTADLAAYLGVTKQAAAQQVDYLVAHDYLRREADPRDGRAKLLALTERGEACTAAADRAATDVVHLWSTQLTPRQFQVMRDALDQIAVPGRLRPAW